MACEQFMRIGRDTFDEFAMERRNEMITALALNFRRDAAAFVKVLAAGYELATERLHCGIFLERVSFRHHDHGRYAVARRGGGHRLTMVATRGGDEPLGLGAGSKEGVDIDHAAARFERAGRRMVFVFDDDL